ncbi:MAG: hypothetical protein WD646_02720 [Actinomycetota bacterium]
MNDEYSDGNSNGDDAQVPGSDVICTLVKLYLRDWTSRQDPEVIDRVIDAIERGEPVIWRDCHIDGVSYWEYSVSGTPLFRVDALVIRDALDPDAGLRRLTGEP